MRGLGFIAVIAVLPACQMGLPIGQKSLNVADSSAEANLAAAFEQAALAADIAPKPAKKGLLGFLKPVPPVEPDVLAGTDIAVVGGASVRENTLSEDPQVDGVGDNDAPEAQDTAADAAGPVLDTVVPVKSGLGGIFGFLTPKQDKTATQAALKAPQVDDAPSDAAPVDATDAAVPPTKPESGPENENEAPRAAQKSMFGFLKSKTAGGAQSKQSRARKTAVSTVALGETLPFGVVGVSCEVRPKDMGTRVDQFPNSGAATWRIYDTNPSSTTPRTQFITGFKDGCARQVTAALILFGAPSLHEVHRYAKTRSKVSWSKADDSYEVIKTKVCGVARQMPCPEEKIAKLETQMAFVSVYKQFGDAKGWLELLLHNGKVATKELR